MKVPIGINLADNKDVILDVMKLIESRLLIEATSGGGKSMTCRTFLEETFDLVPQIIFDKEGEFASLREKHDYILIGKGGDKPADIRTAQLLARKVLEMNASVIIDLYDLKPEEKHKYVRLFIEALIDAPKEFWGPRIVLIDEAHKFCPENGEGVSEAKPCIIELCEAGRKRGLGTVLVTQRIAKLDKSAVSECQNKIIGLTSWDDDRKRAAKELGFSSKEDIYTLAKLTPGEFYVVGPALSRDVIKVKINKAKTTHPKLGKGSVAKVPGATSKVRKMLEKLKDLPEEAIQEARTVADFKARIKQLEQEYRKLQQTNPAPKVDPKVIETYAEQQVAKALDKYSKDLAQEVETYKGNLKSGILSVLGNVSFNLSRLHPKKESKSFSKPLLIGRDKLVISTPPAEKAYRFAKEIVTKTVEEDERPLCRGEQEILKFLYLRPNNDFSKIQIGAMTGYSGTSGTFNTYVSRLTTKQYVAKKGNNYVITQLGAEAATDIPNVDKDISEKQALENWLGRLGVGPRKIYESLLESPDKEFSKEEVLERTGFSNSGTFNTYISNLCTLGLVVRTRDTLKINPEILGICLT